MLNAPGFTRSRLGGFQNKDHFILKRLTPLGVRRPGGSPRLLAATLSVLRMPQSSADQAMARYSSGEDQAFDEVYETVGPALERFLLRRTQDHLLTEDLLQQTFLKMHCHRGSFRAGEPVLPWAYAIALRLLIDRTRSRRREGRVVSDAPLDELLATSGAPTPDQRAQDAQLLRQLEDELARLPSAQRRALEVVRLEGHSLAEAAVLLDTTVAGVKLRLFRAVTALRALLERDTPEAARKDHDVGP